MYCVPILESLLGIMKELSLKLSLQGHWPVVSAFFLQLKQLWYQSSRRIEVELVSKTSNLKGVISVAIMGKAKQEILANYRGQMNQLKQ